MNWNIFPSSSCFWVFFVSQHESLDEFLSCKMWVSKIWTQLSLWTNFQPWNMTNIMENFICSICSITSQVHPVCLLHKECIACENKEKGFVACSPLCLGFTACFKDTHWVFVEWWLSYFILWPLATTDNHTTQRIQKAVQNTNNVNHEFLSSQRML